MANTSITTGQKRDIRRLFAEVLDKISLDKLSAQRVLGRGGLMKFRIGEILKELGESKLLKLVGCVHLPNIDEFRAVDYFTEDGSGEFAIGYIGNSFQQTFLSNGSKVETNIAASTLLVHQVLEDSVNRAIIAELGDEDAAETTLAQMYKMLKLQRHISLPGNLSTRNVNIFYIRDASGILWKVCTSWHEDRWFLSAGSVENTSRIYKFCQVIS